MVPSGDRAKSCQNIMQDPCLWKERGAPEGHAGWIPPCSQERGNQADFLEGKRQLKPAKLGKKREYIHTYTECVRAKLL